MEQIQRKTRRLELVLGPEDGGVKVDTLLRRRLHLSGTVIRRIKWLEDGILLDGMRVTTACRWSWRREGLLSVRAGSPACAGALWRSCWTAGSAACRAGTGSLPPGISS